MSLTIRKLWRKQEGKFFCISTRVPNVENTWKDHFFPTDEFWEIPKFLEEHSHLDIYFCPHGFNRRARTAEESVAPYLLWADLDEVNPELIPDKLKPTIAIQSSEGRFVGLWVLTDKPMTLELNKRLNKQICPESHSSWIFTKALRMPGTRNRKYKPPHKVVLLWTDGPKYTFAKLDRLLEPLDEGKVSGNNAREVFRRYRKFIPTDLQREILGGKTGSAKPGKRSEMMWKIIKSFIEAGADEDEVFEIVSVSRWNKFAGMRYEERSIRRQIAKAFSEKLADAPGARKPKKEKEVEPEDEDEEEFEFQIKRMSEVEDRDIDWLWPGKIPKGELTIFEGDPGVGKSFFIQWLGVQVCDGRRLPSEYPTGVKPIKGKVLYFDFENDASTTTIKRLRAAQCKNMDNFIQVEDIFTMGDEEKEEALDRLMGKIKPELVVFDTLNHYLGAKGDINNSKDATQALAPFHRFARNHGCAVVVLRHLNKSSTTMKAIYRGQGNIAQTGVARVVLTAAKLDGEGFEEYEGEGWCALGTTKNNLSALGKALVYKIEFDPKARGGHDENAHIRIDGFIDKTSDEILSPAKEDRGGKKKDEMTEKEAQAAAESFLLDLLKNGEVMRRQDIVAQAEKAGISQKDLHHASKEVGVRKNKGDWYIDTKGL